MEIQSSGRNYSWPLFLILVGLLLLLNTTGYVGWGIWVYISRFWPVLVILIGIKIVLGNTFLAKSVEILATLVLTLFVFGVAYIQYTNSGLQFLPSNVNSWVLDGGSGPFNLNKDNVQGEKRIEKGKYEDLESVKFYVDLGAGSMKISDDIIDDFLVITEDYPATFKTPVLQENEKEGVLELKYGSASFNQFNVFPTESNYEIVMGRVDVPFEFDITIGAGNGNVNIEKIPITNFYTQVGAGRLDIVLGKDSVPTGEVYFDIGAGNMSLTLPESVEYELEYELGVGEIKIEGERIKNMPSGTGEYTSDGYSSSTSRVKINVNVGVGSFNIN